MAKFIEKYYVYILFFLLFIIQVIIINPLGEFALNDDWVHTASVYKYLSTGLFNYPGWISPNSHVNIGYGILLGKLFGFSFSLLRISNLLLALASVFLFYKLLRRLEVSTLISFLLSLLLWFNPLFFNLSYTFMSDIPALFFLIASAYFYLVGLREDKLKHLISGSVFSIVGFFTRQINIVLFIVAGVYLLWQKKASRFKSLVCAFIIPGAVLILLYFLLYKFNALPTTVSARFLPEGWSYTKQIITNIWQFLLLISFFSLPVSWAIFIKNIHWLKYFKFWVYFFVAGFAFIIATINNSLFLSLGNMINAFGLGPNSTIMQGQISGGWSPIILTIITAVLTFNLVILVCVMSHKETLTKNISFLYYFFFAYMLIITPVLAFDRYLLLVLPIILIYFGQVLKVLPWSRSVFIVLLIVMTMYSIIGTYNYLSWNRTRWEIGKNLLQSGVVVADIEGGYEWNGWHIYDSSLSLGEETPTWAPWYVKQLTPGHQMKYIIAFSPLGGYEVIEQRAVKNLFSPIKNIYLNKVVPHSLE